MVQNSELKKRKAAREREEKKKTAAASATAKAQKAANDDDLPPHVRFYFCSTEQESIILICPFSYIMRIAPSKYWSYARLESPTLIHTSSTCLSQ
jgi:hypothetical protein